MYDELYRSDALFCHHSIDETPCGSNYEMHAHDNYEVFYFLSGKAAYLVEGTKYPLTPGEILITRVGEAHKLIVDSGEIYHRLIINFKKEILPPDSEFLLKPFVERKLGEQNCYRSVDFASSHYRHCLTAIINETKLSPLPEQFLATNLCAFLFELYNAYTTRIKPVTEKSNQMHRLIDYVNRHITENISLESISDDFYVSKTHLNRIFKEATGSSLWKYVIVKRLILARNMIRNGISPGDACKDCGFYDYSSFYRLYIKEFGATPSQHYSNNRN